MSDFLISIKGYAALTPNEKKLQLADILLKKNIISELFSFIKNESNEKSDLRSAVIVLCDAANKEKFKRQIYSELSPTLAQQLLANDDPKFRKNIAKLIGSANNKRYAHVLIRAIEAEKTEFVLDSLILALGYTDYSNEASDFLNQYQPKSTDPKHLNNEQLAVQKALSSLKKAEIIEDVVLNGANVFLTYPAETPDALKQELKAYDIFFAESDKVKNALRVKLKHLSNAFSFRCFFEVMVELGDYNLSFSHDYITQVFESVDALLNLSQYQIRFDLRYLSPEEKAETMQVLVANTIGTKFTSSPSNYQLEIRLIYQKKQGFCLYAGSFHG